MKQFIVSETLLAATVRYLHSQPYGEVNGLVQALQGLSEYVKPERKEEKKSLVDEHPEPEA